MSVSWGLSAPHVPKCILRSFAELRHDRALLGAADPSRIGDLKY